MIEAFSSHTGLVVPLDRDNVDTDAIMPKQYMKSIARLGFGPYVFDEWRHEDIGYYGKPASERVIAADFVMNQPRYAGASVLLTRRNFGCGSSREHAPWALFQYGFRVLIAESFADIFYNNCCKNKMLPIVLNAQDIETLLAQVSAVPGYALKVDLPAQTVTTPDGTTLHFDIAASVKARLLDGTDDVDDTLLLASEIKAFEERRLNERPWL